MVLNVHPRDGLPGLEGCSFSVSFQQCPETGLGSASPSPLPQAEILRKTIKNRVLTLLGMREAAWPAAMGKVRGVGPCVPGAECWEINGAAPPP